MSVLIVKGDPCTVRNEDEPLLVFSGAEQRVWS